MELRRYALLLWRWLWLIILGMVLAAGAAYITSKRTTPVYSASTKMLISPSKAQVMDTLSYQPEIERLGATYSEMMSGRPVLEEVQAGLGLTEPAAWSVSVVPIRNTQLLELTVEDTDPERAATIANEIPKVFIRQNYELQARRYADSKTGLQRQIDESQANLASLQERINSLEAAASPDQSELDRLLREQQTSKSAYDKVSASYEDLRLQEAKQLDTLLVTEEARSAKSPIRPKTQQNTLLAAIVGAMLALGVAYLIEYLDDVLKDPDGVKAALGLTTLAAVPVAEGNGGTTELAMIAGGQSAVTESYRVLRTNLQFAAVGRPLQTLLVTSPSPSEGKSTMSANLAAALAQGGRKVILVDCDLHRPRQHKLMGLKNNLGLTSGLLDERADLIGLLQDSPVPGLRVLTTGPLPPNPAEVLGSGRMKAVMAALGAEADIVVLDSPPVLSVADSAVLASQVDGVLLVIDAGLTRREMARRALASLQQVQARVVGVALNRVKRNQAGYYYYYYNSHDYHRDSGDGSDGWVAAQRWPPQSEGPGWA